MKTEAVRTEDKENPITRRLLALLLLYAVASVIVAKVIAELAFAGGPI